MEQTRFGFNGFTIKWIAIVTMLIDHIGVVLFPDAIAFRIIGRIAFPLFCFLLVEGFAKTGNVKKYMMRLLLFALISEIPFDLASSGRCFDFQHQNVFWTLFLGLLMMFLIQWAGGSGMIPLVIAAAFCVAAFLIRCDYHAGGIAIIFVLYYLKERPWLKYLLFAAILAMVFGEIEIVGIVSIVPMLLYNGRRGPSMKYFFYLFYPCHLFVLFLIGRCIL